MLGMSQEKLGGELGLTFQQVQKYEKGANRISASRLGHLSHILQVPVSFFFEDAPKLAGEVNNDGSAMPDYVSAFLASNDGLALVKAFSRIKNPKIRQRIVNLTNELVGEEEPVGPGPSHFRAP
jgi:transcriptional regulator with XRE-family HTH domain